MRVRQHKIKKEQPQQMPVSKIFSKIQLNPYLQACYILFMSKMDISVLLVLRLKSLKFSYISEGMFGKVPKVTSPLMLTMLLAMKI